MKGQPLTAETFLWIWPEVSCMKGAARRLPTYGLLSKDSYMATSLLITIFETCAGLDRHGESTVTLFNEAIQ